MKTLSLLMLATLILGCGNENPVSEPDKVSPLLTPSVMVYPGPTTTRIVFIYPETEFTLKFSEELVAVTINGAAATEAGLNWKWSAQPRLPLGAISLKIQWTKPDGSRGFMVVGPYYVANNGGGPPNITVGTVKDGEVDVDPAPINANGLQYDFDEAVTGTIKLTDEAGVDLHWIGNVLDQTATLTPVAGQELVNGTTYKIEIDVQDTVGHQLQMTIPFVTKIK